MEKPDICLNDIADIGEVSDRVEVSDTDLWFTFSHHNLSDLARQRRTHKKLALPRAKMIERTRDHNIDAERGAILLGNQIRARLARGIWIRRNKRSVFIDRQFFSRYPG